MDMQHVSKPNKLLRCCGLLKL